MGYLWISWLSFGFFLLAGVIHLGFFVFEAFLMGRPHIARSLGYGEVEIKAIRPWALNQSVYNLSLALITFFGLWLIFKKQIMISGALVSAAGLTMILAGVTLWFSAPRLRWAAAMQFVPPLLGFVFLILHIKERMG